MALPINEVPRYTCQLPSTGQTITYRPFLVKEEKVMLMAIESQNDEEISQAVADTVQSCIVTDIDMRKVPIFDFEYLFLKIRAKSVGEIVKLRLKCPDDETQIVEHELNLEDVTIDKPDEHNNNIEFEKGYGVILKYPTIASFSNVETNAELSFKILKESIQSIYKNDEVYDRNNISEQELDDYVNSLTQKQYKQLQTFFETMPRIRHKIEYENPKSNKKFTLTLNGTNDFF